MSAVPVSETRPRPAVTPARRGRALLIAGALFLVTLALPFVFIPISEGQAGAHTGFHVVGIIVCAAGIWLLHLLRRDAGRTVKVLSWLATVTLSVWLVGHAGELATVLATDGVAHDHETFERPMHIFFANLAIPGWGLSVLSLLVLWIVLAVQGLMARMRHRE